ncbi:MAG TPA: MFS transporter [Chthonomonadaceae bacterium]|nr:MFS transporter [Chthonomonadaceae bacterium]
MSAAPQSPPASRSGTFAALRHRNFRLMWTSLIVSNSGTWLQSVAQDWLVYRLTGRALDLGYVNAARAIALITLSFPGGAIVDRVDKRRLLLLTQTLFTLSAALLGLLAQWRIVQVWHIIALSFFNAVVLAVDQPARQALLPQLVPRRDLFNAIALQSITFTGAAAIGPALAGPVVRAVGLAGSFYVNAASFFAVIWAVYALRLPPAPPRPRGEKVGEALAAGARYILASAPLRLLIGLMAVFSLFAVPYQALLPVFAARTFHGAIVVLGALRAAPGVGALVSGFLLAHFSGLRHKGWLAVGGGLGFCAALIAFCATAWLPGAIALLFVVGLCTTVFTSTVLTLLQQTTSDQMRGRVMSLFTICMIGLSPLGALPLGWAADRFGVSRAVACGALIAGLYALVVALGRRPVLERLRLADEAERVNG